MSHTRAGQNPKWIQHAGVSIDKINKDSKSDEYDNQSIGELVNNAEILIAELDSNSSNDSDSWLKLIKLKNIYSALQWQISSLSAEFTNKQSLYYLENWFFSQFIRVFKSVNDFNLMTNKDDKSYKRQKAIFLLKNLEECDEWEEEYKIKASENMDNQDWESILEDNDNKLIGVTLNELFFSYSMFLDADSYDNPSEKSGLAKSVYSVADRSSKSKSYENLTSQYVSSIDFFSSSDPKTRFTSEHAALEFFKQHSLHRGDNGEFPERVFRENRKYLTIPIKKSPKFEDYFLKRVPNPPEIKYTPEPEDTIPLQQASIFDEVYGVTDELRKDPRGRRKAFVGWSGKSYTVVNILKILPMSLLNSLRLLTEAMPRAMEGSSYGFVSGIGAALRVAGRAITSPIASIKAARDYGRAIGGVRGALVGGGLMTLSGLFSLASYTAIFYAASPLLLLGIKAAFGAEVASAIGSVIAPAVAAEAVAESAVAVGIGAGAGAAVITGANTALVYRGMNVKPNPDQQQSVSEDKSNNRPGHEVTPAPGAPSQDPENKHGNSPRM